MVLNELIISNFKNHSDLKIVFCQKINCIVGKNGVGKTNILDAIHYLSFCKSYFNSIDYENIKFGENYFIVKGEIEKDEKLYEILCSLEFKKKKIFKVNSKSITKFSDHIGNFPLVIITPNDISLINDGSSERRKFLDSAISQFDKEYLNNLIKYNRIVLQRNALLKGFADRNYFDSESLFLWDDQLPSLAEYINARRQDFMSVFNPIFHKYYEFVSNSSDEFVEIQYSSDLNNSDYRTLLANSLNKDRALQFTSVGVHKDDLQLLINKHNIKKTGSQGQNKTFLIALKLAQFELITNKIYYKPMLLLDDIFDKLDTHRSAKIVELVANKTFGQIFITDTNKEHIQDILNKIDIDNKIIDIL